MPESERGKGGGGDIHVCEMRYYMVWEMQQGLLNVVKGGNSIYMDFFQITHQFSQQNFLNSLSIPLIFLIPPLLVLRDFGQF